MAKTNVKTRRPVPTTHEGAKTTHTPNKLEALKRSALSCMLWEDTFYEDGVSITQRISYLLYIVSYALVRTALGCASAQATAATAFFQ